ncbi:MAG: hypothetical protein JXR07_18685 [Reichenbachiella sp.]
MNESLIALKNIHQKLLSKIDQNEYIINDTHESYKSSVKNLLQYLELRQTDISELQQFLFSQSLSTLDLEMAHVENAFYNLISIIERLKGSNNVGYKPLVQAKERSIEIRKNELFGAIMNKRNVRIMVTLPSEAAHNYQLVHSFVFTGMNIARINCAHDTKEEWLQMIANVKKAEKALGKEVKIAMDLAGPKIRTGRIPWAYSVKKVSPTKNEIGELISPFQMILASESIERIQGSIKVDHELIEKASLNDVIRYVDSRGKKRELVVVEKSHRYLKTEGKKTTYFRKGAILSLGVDQFPILAVPTAEPFLLLKQGELLQLNKEKFEDKNIHQKKKAYIPQITCTSSDVIDDAKLGESIFFDDGKIEGHIESKSNDHLVIKIIQAKLKGSKLKSNKGINLPQSNLSIKGLTKKDREDLQFVCQEADIVNFSFVNSAKDVEDLLEEIELNGNNKKLGIILKIETAKAFNNLPEILMSAMKSHPIGVMVARGDLAVEVGWKKLGVVIKEIQYMCTAAHVPMIWATQVLEGLSKNGTPTRSEIIDAVMSSNSDCVMLNKGPYIINSIQLLNDLIKQFEINRKDDVVLFKKLKPLKTSSNKKHLQNVASLISH